MGFFILQKNLHLYTIDSIIIIVNDKFKNYLERGIVAENKQTDANKRWQEKNREHTRYLRNRSTARSFIKKQATHDDIAELEALIADRKKLISG